jgi:lysophospholipase L1-like esterase
MEKTYSLLALGDSYTIGESIPLHKSFPYQTVQMLRKKGYSFSAPEIIAKTGWTTGELETATKNYNFLSKYDFVSLLIGVNNQYRGSDIIEYKEQLEELLKKAIALAYGKKEHVIIISIPDYGLTPFAQSDDTKNISQEIDVYNGVARALSVQYKTQFADVTTDYRKAVNEPGSVADDNLHPSPLEYEKWADKMAKLIASQLK